MYIMGENPAMSDPDAHHAREALAKLDCLVVQEIFLTETCYHADVILPATAWPEKDGTVTNTDRMVQLGRKALDAPGDAKPDLWIIQEIARRLGLDWNYGGPARRVQRDAQGDELDRRHHVGAARSGKLRHVSVRERRRSRRAGGVHRQIPDADRARASSCRPTSFRRPSSPTREFPFVLITGRQLEHWHTGAMTRRASVLDAIEPEPVASVHPLDLDAIGAQPGDVITVESRRGIISLYARADDGTPRGAVFIPFCFYEAAANLLTNPGARSVRQDSGVQVLRGEGHARRRADAALELRRRPGARGAANSLEKQLATAITENAERTRDVRQADGRDCDFLCELRVLCG